MDTYTFKNILQKYTNNLNWYDIIIFVFSSSNLIESSLIIKKMVYQKKIMVRLLFVLSRKLFYDLLIFKKVISI